MRKGLFDTLTGSNKESSKVWNLCKDLLQQAMRERLPWPTITILHEHTKGKFALHSQSVQQVCRAFIGAVESTRMLKKNSPGARYPHKDKPFYPTIWTSQAAKVKDGVLSLPMGKGRQPIRLRVDLPDGGIPCRIVWKDGYELHVCEDAVAEQSEKTDVVATIDLGEIHQIACVTSEGKGLIVTGRGIRSIKHQNNKILAKTTRLLKKCDKGSRRYRKIIQGRNKQSERNRRRAKDLRHKGTSLAVKFLISNKASKVFVGDPHGVRKHNCGRHHNQRMSQWEYGKDIQYLGEKTARVGIGMFTGSERGTSSTCPKCGWRRRQKGRQWICRRCGFTGHRDLVGATNMHPLAFGVPISCPARATYLQPGPTRLVRPVSSRRADTPRSSPVEGSVGDPPVVVQGPIRDRAPVLSLRPETHPL